MAEMTEQLYEYRWGNLPIRKVLQGRICRVITRGKMNTALVEFIDDNERLTISRNALRKVENG